MAKYTGIVQIKVDGELTESLEGSTLDLGGYERTPVVSNGRVIGYKEKYLHSEVNFKVPWGPESPIEVLRNKVDAVVLFISDAGMTYQLSDAVNMKPPKLADGDMDFTMFGQAAELQ